MGGNVFSCSFLRITKEPKKTFLLSISGILRVFGVPFLQKGDEKAVSSKISATHHARYVETM